MRPIVNMPEDDRVTDIGNMHKNLVEIASVILEISWRTDRQTDRETHRQRDAQTDILVTILRNRSPREK